MENHLPPVTGDASAHFGTQQTDTDKAIAQATALGYNRGYNKGKSDGIFIGFQIAAGFVILGITIISVLHWVFQ